MDPLSPEEEFSSAVSAADSWVESHPSEWTVVAAGIRVPRRTEWSVPCAASPHSGFVTLEVVTGSTRMELHFRCPVSSPTTVQHLRDAFSHVALEDLPHGLTVPNWRFSVLTPVSSFTEGVTFSEAANDRLRVQLETALYGIYGHSTRASCEPMVDGPSSPACFVFREHRIPLSLTVTVPWSGAALD